MRFPRTIGARLILVVTLSTSVIFATMLGFNHLRSRTLIEKEVAASAHNLALASANRVEAALGSVARASENIARHLEKHGSSDREVEALLRRVLEDSPEIHGAGVAFEPGALPGPVRPAAPYLYRDGDRIKAVAPEVDLSYRYQDRYQIAHELGRADWSEPYYREGGADILMATYSVPFYSGIGEARRIRGVVTADISLDQLTQTISAIKVLETGYAFLLSRNGAVVTHPVSDYIMNESIFSLAEAADDSALREVGKRMLRGESGFVPYRGFGGAPARLYYGPIPAAGWSLAIVFPENELFAGIRELSVTVAAIGLVGILLIALVVVVIARSITRPLHSLAIAAGRMSGGDFDVALPAQTARDEVGDLSRAFAAMNRDLQVHIRDLVATTSAKERIEGELSIAHDIQMSILPKMLPPFPNREEFNLFAVIEPAKEVGGDFYDFFQLDENHLCLVIADVSGKGVPASLFMAVTKTLIKATARMGLSPADILCQVNEQIARDNDQSMFVTVFLGVLDLRSGDLAYTNAGHNPPLLMPCQGTPRYLPKSRQLVIGAMEDYPYRAELMRMAPGDRLFLYTDGVTEAMNLQDELYGEERLLSIGSGLQHAPLVDMVEATLANIKAFAGAAAQSDDITIMAIDYLGSRNQAKSPAKDATSPDPLQ
ncbi:SpoIIE family protein phosphatase [Rhodocyclus purpureus]|uniref:SpoIIE family protein phosphatase n=1 Tax=Rhodocyclus purpureus TaxID=1067 RepID=UPI00191206CB|nr:serine/threonine protein phosphatase [Rhodocyclus purpureus]